MVVHAKSGSNTRLYTYDGPFEKPTTGWPLNPRGHQLTKLDPTAQLTAAGLH
jgi:hypothetical protein